ncbi:hypothetical protein M3204_17250 [Mesobacillus subterraneus]|uniref:hypothetical protein n=1 Tax=Mesobacillus subterraneus TaxID=285983 RepID=UPI00203C1826|nr:hypothetical protein [Mesobacillus subterraneus]MCM3666168.1 hypothetical protein [Mesobacillus subterraneus]MCM3685166.1 hypothetical protein [Mesobacillus subterraneus]
MLTKIGFLIISFNLFFQLSVVKVNATEDGHLRFEDIYEKIGYQSVEDELVKFENHYVENLNLPLKLPPVDFTHHFGRFNDLEGEINDSFEIEYISDQIPENHYKVDVRPIKYKIPVKEQYVVKKVRLEDGETANYMNVSGFNVLVFEKDHWQYMLSVDNRIEDKVPLEKLIKIAESIE